MPLTKHETVLLTEFLANLGRSAQIGVPASFDGEAIERLSLVIEANTAMVSQLTGVVVENTQAHVGRYPHLDALRMEDLDGIVETMRDNTAAVAAVAESLVKMKRRLASPGFLAPSPPLGEDEDEEAVPPPKKKRGRPSKADLAERNLLEPQQPATAAAPSPELEAPPAQAPAAVEGYPALVEEVTKPPEPVTLPPRTNGGEVSDAEVKRGLRLMQQKFGNDSTAKITTLLAPYGVKRFSELSPEHYGAVYEAIGAALQ